MLINPESAFAIVDSDGLMTQEMFAWIEEITTAVNDLVPLESTGTPEGSIVASVGRLCIDTNAVAGTGIYYKETGDGDTGWVLRS